MTRALSQEALANAANVDRKFLSQIECGICQPTLMTMCKLAVALGVPLSKLIEWAEQSV
jgi:transcriptional regulator with XRE-family HTH domain